MVTNHNQEPPAAAPVGRKVLIVAASHTGNNIFCTPAIRLLKKHYPKTQLDVVALNKLSSEVFNNNPDIHEIFITNKKRSINKISNNYSAIFCMNDKSGHLVSDIKTNLIPLPFSSAHPHEHHAERLLQATAKIIGCTITDTDRSYVIGSNAKSNTSLLDNANIDKDSILVCIHLGCGRTSIHGWKFWYKNRADHHKLWSVDRYIELAKQLIVANPHIRVVITGTKNEAFLGKEFARRVPGTVNLIGKTTVSELFKLMAQVNLFISQDCGILHVASASNVALLGLFGSTDPASTGPYPLKKSHTVIKRDSMSAIEVNEVAIAAVDLLDRSAKKTSNAH